MTLNGWKILDGYEYLGSNPELHGGKVTVVNTSLRPAIVVGTLISAGRDVLFEERPYLTKSQVRECLRYMGREDIKI